ncbi:hypothetical protein CTKA_01235 [Chthonomonas calidirosea]|uniref:Uncharacterized protein n=1 Tax=Chthonomonas calidirosea (strain DSM 23976 / ICMP 18418 / T49) TaxID=1303518 RepID=S0F076_CHTCT|nr:hypothetical protein CCALI_02853 [Chthonomonas calidirosea T49]CEK16732.1 hypothetical protein CTKA_01235 [Chthonomonas calidirosea]
MLACASCLLGGCQFVLYEDSNGIYGLDPVMHQIFTLDANNQPHTVFRFAGSRLKRVGAVGAAATATLQRSLLPTEERVDDVGSKAG